MRAAYDRLSDADRAKYEKEAAELKAKFEADKVSSVNEVHNFRCQPSAPGNVQ